MSSSRRTVYHDMEVEHNPLLVTGATRFKSTYLEALPLTRRTGDITGWVTWLQSHDRSYSLDGGYLLAPRLTTYVSLHRFSCTLSLEDEVATLLMESQALVRSGVHRFVHD